MADQGAIGGVRGHVEPEVGAGRPADLITIECRVLLRRTGRDEDALADLGVVVAGIAATTAGTVTRAVVPVEVTTVAVSAGDAAADARRRTRGRNRAEVVLGVEVAALELRGDVAENFTQVSEPGRVQPVMPPTLQTLTYSTGAAFLVGRSAACALATATMPAAEPSRRLLMSVICDLQLDVVGVGFLLTFDSGGPPADRLQSKRISPLFPFDLSIAALCPSKCPRPPRPGISRSPATP